MNTLILTVMMGIFAKTSATDIANRAELQLRANRDAYMASSMTRAGKEQALRRFEETWERFIGPEGCGAASLRSYGRRCIEERKRGGEHDWWKWYYDPIADSAPAF
jgi:hypothetical protein